MFYQGKNKIKDTFINSKYSPKGYLGNNNLYDNANFDSSNIVFRLGATSDPHLAYSYSSIDAIKKQAKKYANLCFALNAEADNKLDFLVSCGDWTSNGSALQADTFLSAQKAILDVINMNKSNLEDYTKFAFCYGNHDTHWSGCQSIQEWENKFSERGFFDTGESIYGSIQAPADQGTVQLPLGLEYVEIYSGTYGIGKSLYASGPFEVNHTRLGTTYTIASGQVNFETGIVTLSINQGVTIRYRYKEASNFEILENEGCYKWTKNNYTILSLEASYGPISYTQVALDWIKNELESAYKPKKITQRLASQIAVDGVFTISAPVVPGTVTLYPLYKWDTGKIEQIGPEAIDNGDGTISYLDEIYCCDAEIDYETGVIKVLPQSRDIYYFCDIEYSYYEQSNNRIIILSHPPLAGSGVYGSDPNFETNTNWATNGTEVLYNILKDYPNVIYLSGHTHYLNYLDSTIYQKDFTAIHVSSVNGILHHATSENEPIQMLDNNTEGFSRAMGLLIEFDINGNMRVKKVDGQMSTSNANYDFTEYANVENPDKSDTTYPTINGVVTNSITLNSIIPELYNKTWYNDFTNQRGSGNIIELEKVVLKGIDLRGLKTIDLKHKNIAPGSLVIYPMSDDNSTLINAPRVDNGKKVYVHQYYDEIAGYIDYANGLLINQISQGNTLFKNCTVEFSVAKCNIENVFVERDKISFDLLLEQPHYSKNPVILYKMQLTDNNDNILQQYWGSGNYAAITSNSVIDGENHRTATELRYHLEFNSGINQYKNGVKFRVLACDEYGNELVIVPNNNIIIPFCDAPQGFFSGFANAAFIDLSTKGTAAYNMYLSDMYYNNTNESSSLEFDAIISEKGTSNVRIIFYAGKDSSNNNIAIMLHDNAFMTWDYNESSSQYGWINRGNTGINIANCANGKTINLHYKIKRFGNDFSFEISDGTKVFTTNYMGTRSIATHEEKMAFRTAKFEITNLQYKLGNTCLI